jgi:hypothetical protein
MKYPVYCEQALPAGVFEPINTMTNLFFVAAGIILFIRLKRKDRLDLKGIWFSSLLIIIGFGSFAWHFQRTDFNLMADSIPIGLFVLSYLYFYLARTADNRVYRLLLFFGFFIYTPLVSRLFNETATGSFFDNGGLSYTIALSYFLILQIYTYFFKPELLKKSLIIVMLFFTSIVFRQMDLKLCELIGFGTHFIWHILNSIVLYLFVRLLYYTKSTKKKS